MFYHVAQVLEEYKAEKQSLLQELTILKAAIADTMPSLSLPSLNSGINGGVISVTDSKNNSPAAVPALSKPADGASGAPVGVDGAAPPTSNCALQLSKSREKAEQERKAAQLAAYGRNQARRAKNAKKSASHSQTAAPAHTAIKESVPLEMMLAEPFRLCAEEAQRPVEAQRPQDLGIHSDTSTIMQEEVQATTPTEAATETAMEKIENNVSDVHHGAIVEFEVDAPLKPPPSKVAAVLPLPVTTTAAVVEEVSAQVCDSAKETIVVKVTSKSKLKGWVKKVTARIGLKSSRTEAPVRSSSHFWRVGGCFGASRVIDDAV